MANKAAATILVVDDNPATLYSTTRMLQAAEFSVLEARNGEEGLRLANQRPDVVLLDINLPDVDGFEVCRRLRQAESTTRTPIIYLSATFVNDKHKVLGLDSGADGYLTHPVEPPMLIATVNACLRARRAEEARRQSDERFRAIFNETPNGIGLLDKELKYTEVNPAICRILDRTREEIIGKPVTDFLAAGTDAHQLGNALETTGRWNAVAPYVRPNQSLAQIEWDISAQTSSDVQLVVAADITARMRSETEREQLLNSERAARTDAERANRLKDDFLATLSHELRNPLNVITMWSRILSRRMVVDKEVAEGLEIIERNANIQNQLISDLLDVSRIISGNLRLSTEYLDPGTVVENALNAVTPTAQAKEIQIQWDIDTTIPPILCDPARLHQIIWNLITNAVKFTPQHGTILVKIERSGSDVAISIADNGQGINADFLPYIFDRFRQEDAATTRTHGGLGLGLAIVKHLVEMHGGTVSAASAGVGQGSSFIVRFPAATPDTAALPQNVRPNADALESISSGPDLHGVKILVVDDNDDSRNVVSHVLKNAFAYVVIAADVEEALRMVEEFKPHILVSDIGMPLHDGYSLIREIRRRGHSPHELPAIALTALARPEDRDRAMRAGYQAHISKPIEPGELLISIRDLVTGRGGLDASKGR